MNKKPPYAIHYAFIRQSTRHVSAPTGHHQVFENNIYRQLRLGYVSPRGDLSCLQILFLNT
jgi:hypothetical protein